MDARVLHGPSDGFGRRLQRLTVQLLHSATQQRPLSSQATPVGKRKWCHWPGYGWTACGCVSTRSPRGTQCTAWPSVLEMISSVSPRSARCVGPFRFGTRIGPHEAGRKMQSPSTALASSWPGSGLVGGRLAGPRLGSGLVGERLAGPRLGSGLVGERLAGPWLGSDLVGERLAGADLLRAVRQAFSLSLPPGICLWLRFSPERLPILRAERGDVNQGRDTAGAASDTATPTRSAVTSAQRGEIKGP